ncbi:MAG: hypothetical protein LBC69_01065 [Eubacteriaceae bacterium]|jgi:hypothetical protein|nr:hypothetical protein [Eubacteriaceae bacterium]
MNVTNITIKERGLALKVFAQHSSQHCELALEIASMASLPIQTDRFERLKQSFREIRSYADLLYRKKVRSLSEQAITDFVMLRNITANFNRCTIDLISELEAASTQKGAERLLVFFMHVISEEKQMLEETYALNLP